MAGTEHHFIVESGGSILVREGTPERPLWLVTWLPDEGADGYPGTTWGSDVLAFPTDSGARAAAEWLVRWLQNRDTPDEAPESTPLDVPAPEWTEHRERFSDAGWEFDARREPEGGYTWWTRKGDEVIGTGFAETWDDAKLDSIVDFPPPSGET